MAIKHVVNLRTGRKGIAVRRYGKRRYVVVPDDRTSYNGAHDDAQPSELWWIGDCVRHYQPAMIDPRRYSVDDEHGLPQERTYQRERVYG